MAGGIYVNKPFSFNLKCIVFAFTMVGLYWLISRFSYGKPNYWLFFLIFIIAYIAMAWYDYAYNCDDKLYSGTTKGIGLSTFDSIFKPQLRNLDHKKDTVVNQEKAYQRNVYLFHILLVTPILLYVGIQGMRGKLNSSDWYAVLIVIGLGVLLYHGYRFFYPRQTCNIIVEDQQQ